MLFEMVMDNWKLGNSKCILKGNTIENKSNKKVTISYSQKLSIKDIKNVKKIKVDIQAVTKNSGGYISLNDKNIPLNSEAVIDIKRKTNFSIKLTIAANSSVKINKFVITSENDKNLLTEIDNKRNVLIIVPDYPSYVNLYACAFAHSRNKEYVKNNLKIQVFAVNSTIDFQTKYERDNVPVIRGSYKDLKELLSTTHYPVVMAHFVDEKLYPIFEGNIYDNQKLLFICHGPEVVYKYLVNVTRPYFSKPVDFNDINKRFELSDFYVRRFSQKDNVEWIFVSNWLKEFAEKEQGFKFKHSRVINNVIDEELFPYTKRDPELRKKIIVVRKFDNICQHSIDQIVLCIMELSRRSFFKDLEFDIYGDGYYYDELVEPLRQFSNVHLIRRFIPNEQLNDVYKEHGIILLPSRHDAHAVSMGESASTGLVVLGSNVTSNPYFMNEKENHTLTDPEDYVGLANIIERLYKDPKEFSRISENMSKFTRQFVKENTVKKEIDLIKESLKETKKLLPFTPVKKEKPILTIGVPAYNVEKYIEKTLVSILKCKNAGKIEVLVINDGSKDSTSQIVKKYEKLSNGIVRLIEKENGGHGSTINRAIKEAKGKYFRLVDGDDWVDHENLDKLIEIMQKNDNDIILTTGSYDYIEQAAFENIISYNSLVEGSVYNFEDLTYPNYGFDKYGPLLTTGNYKTEMLKKSGFLISEKKPYVDMEFNAFSIRLANTITYYDLNIYRYLIGREGQTVSRDFWKKKYKDHEYIIFNILDYLSNNDYSDRKRKYVLRNIIAPMVDSQIFMYDAICKWGNIDHLLERLKDYQGAYEESIDYIKKVDGNCALILMLYKKKAKKSDKSIIIPGVIESIKDYNDRHIRTIGSKSLKSVVKKTSKAVLPYGVVRIIQRRRG